MTSIAPAAESIEYSSNRPECETNLMRSVNLPPLPDLMQHLHGLIGQVPPGRVTTYGALAAALGNVVASRWVGHCLLHDDRAADWPTHRVVRHDGSLGLYAHGGPSRKAERLAEEGVAVRRGRVNLDRLGCDQFRSSRPLEQLRNIQNDLRDRCRLEPMKTRPRHAAGLDVSYRNDGTGVGGYALVEVATGALLWSSTVTCAVDFPYISSYLAFRELPVLAELLEAARAADRVADVYLVDGAGIMHPRRFGVATHFGVLADIPTIGVTKKLLAGRIEADSASSPPESKPQSVFDGEDWLGVSVRPRKSSRKRIYISPGHRIDPQASADLALALLKGRALPEPIYWADRLSRQSCREMESTK